MANNRNARAAKAVRAGKKSCAPKTEPSRSAVADYEIRDILYLPDDTAAAYLGIDRARVAKIRASAPKRTIPHGGQAIKVAYGDQAVALAESAARDSSKSLLRALLRYGLKHDSDLGMGAGPFRARCAEMGVAAAARLPA